MQGNPEPLLVTNHAIVRYLERVEGHPVAWPLREGNGLAQAFVMAQIGAKEVRRVRGTIAEAVAASGCPLDWQERLVVRMPNFQAVILNGAILTVKKLDHRNRPGSQVFTPAHEEAAPQ